MYIVGKNAIKEAILNNRKIYGLYVVKGTNKDFLPFLKQQGVYYELIEKSHKVAKEGSLVADVEEYKYYSLEEVLTDQKQVFLMLDSIEDPHNLGAILRSVEAFGIDCVIIPKSRSVKLNKTVAKVSVGAIEHTKVVMVSNLNNTIKKLKDNGFWIVGTDMVASKTASELEVDTNLVIVIGNEGTGIKRLVKENCDYMINIPMVGSVNSLNASVSAAIIMYEVMKKKG